MTIFKMNHCICNSKMEHSISGFNIQRVKQLANDLVVSLMRKKILQSTGY